MIDGESHDPVLVTLGGQAVNTWREGYPYQKRLRHEEYVWDKRLLPIEPLKLQRGIKSVGGSG